MAFAIRRPLAYPALALAAGAALGAAGSTGNWPWAVGAFWVIACGWLVVVLARGRVRWDGEAVGTWFVLAACGAAGCALLQMQRHPFDPGRVDRVTAEHYQPGELEGVVASMPRARGARIEFAVRAETWRPAGGGARRCSGWVQARLERGGADLLPGQRVRLEGGLRAPRGPVNPGAFDRRAWCARRNVYREMVVRRVERLGAAPVWARWTCGMARGFRELMRRALSEGIAEDPDTGAVLHGMLFGEHSEMPEAWEEWFRRTGTLHLFAVSGQNVGVLAVVGLLVMRLGGLQRWRWGWGLIPALGLYTLATGADPSAVRAWVMASLVLAAWALDRPALVVQLLAAAGMGILLGDPSQVLDIGFQLSFAVVAALALLTPPLFGWMRGFWAPDPLVPRAWWHPVRRALETPRLAVLGCAAGSVAAFAGSAPLCAWHFHLVTPSGIPVNILVVPLASAVVVVGAMAVALFPVSAALASVCNNANWLVARALVAAVQAGAGLPGAAFHVGEPGASWGGAQPRVTVLAVGSGQAAVVESEAGVDLFDTGSRDDARFAVGPCLRWLGVNRLRSAWLSLGNAGHIGGAPLVLESVAVEEVWTPGLKHRSPFVRRLPERAVRRLRAASAGQIVERGAWRWRVFWPESVPAGPLAEDRCLVARLESGAGSVLFAGDIGATVEAALAARGGEMRADFVVKGLHPREDCLTGPFLDAVRPRFVLFAGGGYEGAGLTGEQRGRLSARGIGVRNLAETGAVVLAPERSGDGAGWVWKEIWWKGRGDF